MQQVNVLNLQRIAAEDRAQIEAVDPRVQLTDAGGWFDGEYRDTWPAFTSMRYLSPNATGTGTREDRDRLLAAAEVILGGWPFPLDLHARSPRLRWFHQRPAGASNLLRGDLWGSTVTVTTSRGSEGKHGDGRIRRGWYPCTWPSSCEQSLQSDRHAAAFSPRAYRPLLLAGKTVCIVGAGGIGLLGRSAPRRARHAGRRHPAPSTHWTAPCHRALSALGGAVGILTNSCPIATLRCHLLPLDAGDEPSLRHGPVCRHEARSCTRQRCKRRDRR